MSVDFSQIPAKFNYPRHVKGKLSSLHSDIITYVSTIYDGSHDLRNRTIRLLNTLTRYIIEGDTFPENWSSTKNPFEGIEIEDELSLKENLEKLYINPKDVHWDISPVSESVVMPTNKLAKPVKSVQSSSGTNKPSTTHIKIAPETDKSDLYISPPTVPQFDVNKPWVSAVIDGTVYCIYTSVPAIPTKQNEVSATTDSSLMKDEHLLRLYPKNFIKTRSPSMYNPVEGLKCHPQLGIIIPIAGFTENQLIDNLIKYPHLFKLSKMKDEEVISFYNTIEIDGELMKVSDVWKELPDTSKIPYTADFVKEYVVRRYLLERDVKKIQHRFPMYGTLDPYLTLFSTTSDYISWGHTRVVDIARQCVDARVSYKRSRNPVLRRVESV